MDVRTTVLQRLVTPQSDGRFGRPYLVGQIAAQVGCPEHQVWEALWGLVGDGLIYLDTAGQGSGTDNWQWRPSKIGIQAATSGSWEPRDPEGYLRRLRRFQPAIDQGALLYVEEALRAFNARCYLATSVMLGVAAERVFNGLAEAFVAANPTTTTKLRDAMNNPRSSQYVGYVNLSGTHRGNSSQTHLDVGDLPGHEGRVKRREPSSRAGQRCQRIRVAVRLQRGIQGPSGQYSQRQD